MSEYPIPELKSCPFCGSPARWATSTEEDEWEIQCTNQECLMLVYGQERTARETAAAWNTRPDIARLSSENARLQWRPITATDLPSIGDEIFAHSIYKDKSWDTVSSMTKVHAEWRVDDFLNCGWTHFRPINPPARAALAEKGLI